MKNPCISVRAETHERLKKEAQRRGVSLSALVTQLIEAAIAAKEQTS